MKTKEENAALPTSPQAAGSAYFRPKTRGEMRSKLKSGIACEVCAMNALISLSLLRSLDVLKDDGFEIDTCTVRKSENKGFAVFEPNVKHEG